MRNLAEISGPFATLGEAVSRAVEQRVVVLVGVCLLAAAAWSTAGCNRSTAQPTSQTDCQGAPVTHAEWSKARAHVDDEDAPTALQRLADRLVHCRALIGDTTGEVRALLGRPSSGDYFSGGSWPYFVGPERTSPSIDSEWLVVHFDSNGRVVRASIQRD
jgi:SmpA / OmlA family